MNREEALKIIEENRIFYRDYKQEQFNEALEYLKQPITLADFLGWEEDVEYTCDRFRYKIVENKLLYLDDIQINDWQIYNLQFCNNDISKLRDAKKIEKKKFYAKIKGASLISDSCYCWNYSNINKGFILASKTENEDYKTKFTKEEWSTLGINDTNADFEEVK